MIGCMDILYGLGLTRHHVATGIAVKSGFKARDLKDRQIAKNFNGDPFDWATFRFPAGSTSR
jgi:hypothetical protein